jgi:hypothetical protein
VWKYFWPVTAEGKITDARSLRGRSISFFYIIYLYRLYFDNTTYFHNILMRSVLSRFLMKFSPLIVELLDFILISSCNFYEHLFTSISDLNTNVNSWRHNFNLIFMKFSALNAEINIVSSSYNFQGIVFLLSLKNWFKN